MIVRDALVSGTLGRLVDGTSVAMDPGFQGLPGMAHGGTVLALFDAAADLAGARRVRAHYMKKVPLGPDLGLRRVDVEGRARFDLVDPTGQTLVDGDVGAADTRRDPGSGSDRRVAEPPGTTSGLPVSSSCFVCGIDNPIGLGAELSFDEDLVTGVWQPRAHLRTPDGRLAPVALTALLDEGAFWLGALATGESGMTTELEVTLARPLAFGSPVTIVGDRRRVAPRPDDPRYVDTALVALAEGEVVATARITFVAVRGAARRLASWLARTNPPETIRRVFPTSVVS
jgi:acyl-coenzyme A thioesterase PaaI-like protein